MLFFMIRPFCSFRGVVCSFFDWLALLWGLVFAAGLCLCVLGFLLGGIFLPDNVDCSPRLV